MRILYIATIGGFMPFFKSLIGELLESGNEIDIATNMSQYPVPEYYEQWGCGIFQISCSRSPLNKGNVDCIGEIRKIVSEKHYDIVHCHTPIAAACTRVACRKVRKTGTKVIYTAHGFHFYDGAPRKNWMIYYPIEKYLSKYTDVLITINKEDYKRACEKFHSNKIVYVPGVGIDINKFKPDIIGRKKIRDELELDNQRIVLLSVGELNENKNHIEVIRAISGFDFTYVIVGKGQLGETLKSEAEKLGVDLRLMGFRRDVADFYNSADMYILPSIREGLNVSLMEAMASGLPCAVSKIRGNIDLIEDSLFDPKDSLDIREKVLYTLENKEKFGLKNMSKIKDFSILSVNEKMKDIYDV